VFGFRLVLLADADHECISGLGTGDLECLYAYVSVGSGEGRRGDTYAEDSGGFGQVHGVFALDWFLPVVFHVEGVVAMVREVLAMGCLGRVEF